MKNYIISIEEKLRQILNLEIAILELIKKAFDSKRNTIPHVESKTIHNLLLKEGIVRDYQGTHYLVEDSNLLAHVIYLYFKDKFGIPNVNSFESLNFFINHVSNFIENHPNRWGIHALTNNLRSYLFILINHKENYQFDHVFKLSEKEEYDNSFFESIRPVQKALKYLILLPENIITLIDHCINISKNPYDWNIPVKERCVENTSEAWKLYEAAKEKNLPYLLANILQAISISKYSEAFIELKKLFNSIKHKTTALIGFSYINYPKETFIDEVLNLIINDKENYAVEKANIFSTILKSSICTEKHKETCIFQLEKRARLEDANIKSSILHHILHSDIDEEIVIKILKEHYVNGATGEERFWNDINHGIYRFENKNLIVDFFEHFVQLHPSVNFAQKFSFIIQKIPKGKISYWITKWFNDEKFILTAKAGELVRSLSTSHIDLVLSKELLDSYSLWDIEYIIRKVLGFIYDHKQLSHLVFSALQRSSKDEDINTLVESSFQEYILFNYKSPLEFLRDKKKNGSKLEKKIAGKIIREFNKRIKARKNLPLLKELQGSPSRLQEYLKKRSKKFNLEENIRKGSVFMHFAARNINLRTGKGFFMRQLDGDYSTPTILGKFGMEVELPAGEFIDPTGQAIFRITCQSFKRRT